MASAGVSSEHAERVLGHAIVGVEGVYDRHHYRDETADALSRLARLITQIVDGEARQQRRAAARTGGAAVSAKAKKRRTRKPLSLSADEIAEIDELIALRSRRDGRADRVGAPELSIAPTRRGAIRAFPCVPHDPVAGAGRAGTHWSTLGSDWRLRFFVRDGRRDGLPEAQRALWSRWRAATG